MAARHRQKRPPEDKHCRQRPALYLQGARSSTQAQFGQQQSILSLPASLRRPEVMRAAAQRPHTHTHTLSLSLSHTHTHTHTRSLSHTHTLTHKHTQTQRQTYMYTQGLGKYIFAHEVTHTWKCTRANILIL